MSSSSIVRTIIHCEDASVFVMYLNKERPEIFFSVLKERLNISNENEINISNHNGLEIKLETIISGSNDTISIWVRHLPKNASIGQDQQNVFKSIKNNSNQGQITTLSTNSQTKSPNSNSSIEENKNEPKNVDDVLEKRKALEIENKQQYHSNNEKALISNTPKSNVSVDSSNDANKINNSIIFDKNIIKNDSNENLGISVSSTKTSSPTSHHSITQDNNIPTTIQEEQKNQIPKNKQETFSSPTIVKIDPPKPIEQQKHVLITPPPSSEPIPQQTEPVMNITPTPITQQTTTTTTTTPTTTSTTQMPTAISQPAPTQTSAADARLQRILQKQQELERKMKEKEVVQKAPTISSTSKRAQSTPNLAIPNANNNNNNNIDSSGSNSAGTSPKPSTSPSSSSSMITAPDQNRYLEEKKRQEMEYAYQLELRTQSAMREKEKQLQAMMEEEKKRKLEDRKIKGFSERDTYHKNTEELQKEQQKNEEEEQRAGNKSWAKTETGWQRAFEPQGQGYKSKPTRDTLPIWLYDELALSFGLRRSSSPDFVTSCSVLQQLLIQWFLHSPKPMQKRLLADVAFVYSQLDKTNVLSLSNSTIDIVNELFKTTSKCVTDVKNDRKATFQSTQAEEAELQQIEKWNEGLKVIAARVSSTNPSVDQVSPFHSLPSEMIIEIFSWLSVPDLYSAALVCNRFNCLSNEEVLFNVLLKRIFPHTYPKAKLPFGQTFKELFVNAHTFAKKQRPNRWRTSGFFSCKNCNQFYWGASNNTAACANIRSSTFHQEDSSVNTQKIVQAILGRKVAVASDVLFL